MALSEADTRAKLIDPALYKAGWTEEFIKREETAGAIEIVNGKPRQKPKKFIDYTLRVKISSDTQAVAVAVVEAKADHLPPAHGLEQAKRYAVLFNVPFAFSTNGKLFVEYDRFTDITSSPRPLTEFPTCDDLRQRYEAGQGFELTDPEAKPLVTPYQGGETIRRYYQDAAIRAVLEKIAKDKSEGRPPRALLTLATGAGKTRIAAHILRKIADASQLRRALFICDRDELRKQAAAALQSLFGADAATVTGNNPQKNARVLIATYQTLDIDTDDADANFLVANYGKDYFSHIVIDECHRSAWGKWSEVLQLNPNAVQIGLTATPRQLDITAKNPEALNDQRISADNIAYFGEPVYEYDMAQGIADGYLAACEIRTGRVNLDETGITIDDILVRNPTDAITGEPITREQLEVLYEKTSFEDRLLLPDRVYAMCADLFNYLLQTGSPEQKTVIYCVRDSHAEAVAIEMNNLYTEWCRENGARRVENYAFKCTAASGGRDYLADLRGSSRSYFVATTVELLTTGVDIPALQNVAFFRYLKSPISFYQMLGRGTRLDTPSNKLMFRVYDYTDATRLFGASFLTKFQAPSVPSEREPEPAREQPPIVTVHGFEVHITDAGRFIVTEVDGHAMPVTVEEYKARLAAQLVAEAQTIEIFRQCWINPDDRATLLARLPEQGRSALLVQSLEQMEAYDLYDVLGELGYGLQPRTRIERVGAFSYKHEEWLKSLDPTTATTIKALVGQFAQAGIEELENPQIFQTPEVVRAGGLSALKKLGQPADVLLETKERIFAA